MRSATTRRDPTLPTGARQSVFHRIGKLSAIGTGAGLRKAARCFWTMRLRIGKASGSADCGPVWHLPAGCRSCRFFQASLTTENSAFCFAITRSIIRFICGSFRWIWSFPVMRTGDRCAFSERVFTHRGRDFSRVIAAGSMKTDWLSAAVSAIRHRSRAFSTPARLCV